MSEKTKKTSIVNHAHGLGIQIPTADKNEINVAKLDTSLVKQTFEEAMQQQVQQKKTHTQEYWKSLILGDKNSSKTLNTMVDFIKYPVITQKTYIGLVKNRQYTFNVDPRLSKPQIKKLFENLFNVNILSVNTHIPPRKKLRVGATQGYKPRYKRAILTIKEGQSLNFNLKES
jgi:large subunit ribosomal protein L23